MRSKEGKEEGGGKGGGGGRGRGGGERNYSQDQNRRICNVDEGKKKQDICETLVIFE